MNYLEFKEALQGFTVFSINEIMKIDPRFHRRRLNDWQEKGYLKKIIKGYYIFSDLQINEHVLFEIANKIHRPSYISLEMALSNYHLIPESHGKRSKIACPEKTILDYFYMNPQLSSSSDFASLRIDASAFREHVNEGKLFSLLEKFSQKRLTGRMHAFMDYMKNA